MKLPIKLHCYAAVGRRAHLCEFAAGGLLIWCKVKLTRYNLMFLRCGWPRGDSMFRSRWTKQAEHHFLLMFHGFRLRKQQICSHNNEAWQAYSGVSLVKQAQELHAKMPSTSSISASGWFIIKSVSHYVQTKLCRVFPQYQQVVANLWSVNFLVSQKMLPTVCICVVPIYVIMSVCSLNLKFKSRVYA